jgi:hypothetical protein
LPSNYGKSLNYQVAIAKTGLISRGEPSLVVMAICAHARQKTCQKFVHMRDRKRVRSRQRSLLLRFPAQIETSASREALGSTLPIIVKTCQTGLGNKQEK